MSDPLTRARTVARTMMLPAERQAVEQLADAHEEALKFIAELGAEPCCLCPGWIREGDGLEWGTDQLAHDICFAKATHDQRVDEAEARLDGRSHREEVDDGIPF